MDKFSKKKLEKNCKEIVKNAHLGELENEDMAINVHIGKAKSNLAPSVILYQEAGYWAATTLKPASNSVIMLFLSISAFENYVGIDQSTIAEKLKMTVRTVQKSIRELIEYNVIVKIQNPTDKRRSDYFINPFMSWKGKQNERRKMIQKIKKDEMNKNQLSLFPNEEYEISNESDLYRLENEKRSLHKNHSQPPLPSNSEIQSEALKNARKNIL